MRIKFLGKPKEIMGGVIELNLGKGYTQRGARETARGCEEADN
jgi:hypothetical protein